MLYYFIFVMPPIRAAKQRRNGIAEPRSGRSDGEGERGRRSSGGVLSRRRAADEARTRGSGAYELGSGDKHNLIVPSDAT